MSKLFAFKDGGVHPADRKELSAGAAIEAVPAPAIVTVPISQHLGAPAKAVAKKGDEVLVGQVLAEPGGFVSAPVHSPVSGKIRKLVDIPTAGGDRIPAFEIQNDGEDNWAEGIDPAAEAVDFDQAETFMERIKEAGIVGMGGAAFPTHVKLSPPKDSPVDTLVLNGAECEPYLTADYRLMLEQPEGVMAGIRILQAVLGVKDVIVGIEDNKPDACEALSKVAPADVKVELCRTRYPQGAEKQLIEALTGRRVPPGKLPFAVGVIVQNVGTAYAVFEAVARRKPLIERVVTVTGRAAKQPGNFLARLGTPVQTLMDKAEADPDLLRAMISGGPMMGRAFRHGSIPVMKATSGILLMSAEELQACKEQDCIRCGRCVDACPMNLMPCDLANLSEFGEYGDAASADNCVECGCCQYVCPSRRFLVQWIRLAKNMRRRAAK